MKKYPLLNINLQIIESNAKILLDLCRKSGVEPFAVIKGFNGLDAITGVLVETGYKTIGSSRIPHLKRVKDADLPVQTLALRIPMHSEVQELIRYCDISLNSEVETLCLLDREARSQGRIHKVIIMRDLGDLREGIIDRQNFINTAIFLENELSNLHLYGVGANLTCYGSVMPTTKNLSILVEEASEIETAIGRKLEIVSGGGTTSIPLAARGEMPEGINNLRIGEAIILPFDLMNIWKCPPIAGMSSETMMLEAEIIEIGEKPTLPIGKQGANCFGSICTYEDRGIRRRALVATGLFDIGDHEKVMPEDEGLRVLGASSDHMIVDIQDSNKGYRLGDVVTFNLRYQSMLFATNSDHITKIYRKSCEVNE